MRTQTLEVKLEMEGFCEHGEEDDKELYTALDYTQQQNGGKDDLKGLWCKMEDKLFSDILNQSFVS